MTSLPFAPRGLLFVGDPHVSSIRPGRRNDDYLASVLGKLSAAARIAHERRLVPVITGDLIHRNAENSMGMVTRLLRVLREFPCAPLDLEGNHGKSQSRFSVGDIELLLAEAGALRLIERAGWVETFDFEGARVALYATPYGEPIPAKLSEYGELQGDTRILLTHHDLAFETSYPGAIPLFEVKDAHLLINGHMHKTAPSVRCGMTMLHCPGNIEPLSVDCIDHVPAVWEWTPASDQALEKHELAHERNCFDLTGQLVAAAADAGEAVEALVHSQFAELLQADASMDAERTDEAAILREDLEAVLTEAQASEATGALLRLLAEEVAADAARSTSA
jgi:hypothetical protein